MNELAPALTLALSLAIGLLVGTERGWQSRTETPGTRVAGVRTFGLLGLLGGVVGLVGIDTHPIIAAILLGAAAAALVGGYIRDMRNDGQVSATVTIAGLLTLALGVLATSGKPALAVASAAAATLLLSMRHELHSWLRRLSDIDIRAIARFAIIAAAILPLLPDRSYGPYDAWNPQQLWFVVVLVTGFSFAGYGANRLWGQTRGTLVTAAITGMYSSTAVTLALSRRLQSGEGSQAVLSAGVALASAMMFVRVLILCAILAPLALPGLALIVGPAAVVAAGFALWLVQRSREEAAGSGVESGNPFELLPALGFALVVAVLAVAVRWAEIRFGGAGVATLIALSGSFDVDAAIVTMGGLSPGAIDPALAGVVLAVPILVNTLFKAGIAIVTAGWRKGGRAAIPLLASSAVMPLVWLTTR